MAGMSIKNIRVTLKLIFNIHVILKKKHYSLLKGFKKAYTCTMYITIKQCKIKITKKNNTKMVKKC